MIKLVKYEFRKAWTAMLVLLGITAALQLWYMGSLMMNAEDHIVISAALLFFCTYAVAIFVLIRGITTYSGELKSRSSYLIFMTPNSALKIVGSKFVYTFANAFFFMALYGLLGAADIALMLDYFGELEYAIEGIRAMLNIYGVYVDQILLACVFLFAFVFLEILSTVATAYLAITLSHTLFGDKKWRWLPSLGLFGLMNWGISWINDRFPSAMDQLVMVEISTSGVATEAAATVTQLSDLVPYLMPTAGVCLAVILISLFGCAALLEKKVSL